MRGPVLDPAGDYLLTMEAADKSVRRPASDPWRDNEEARRRRLREHGKRPLAVNLAESLALTEYLAKFTGSARKG